VTCGGGAPWSGSGPASCLCGHTGWATGGRGLAARDRCTYDHRAAREPFSGPGSVTTVPHAWPRIVVEIPGIEIRGIRDDGRPVMRPIPIKKLWPNRSVMFAIGPALEPCGIYRNPAIRLAGAPGPAGGGLFGFCDTPDPEPWHAGLPAIRCMFLPNAKGRLTPVPGHTYSRGGGDESITRPCAFRSRGDRGRGPVLLLLVRRPCRSIRGLPRKATLIRRLRTR
jgi:hypothetical protein